MTSPANANNQSLVLPGSAGEYASTPDSVATSITGDIDVRWYGTQADWTPATEATLIAKWNTTGNQRSYRLYCQTGGTIVFAWSANGSTTSSASGWATGLADGAKKWIRATLDIDNGSSQKVVTFYDSDDGISWTTQATVTTGTVTSIFNSTSTVDIGDINNGGGTNLVGSTFYAEIRNGIAGSVVAQYDPSTVTITSARVPTTLVAGTGETWTMNGSAWSWGTGNTTVTAVTVAAVAAVPASAESTGSSFTAVTVAAVAGVGTPTVKTGTSVTAVTVAAVAAVPTPSVVAGNNVTVVATTVAAVAAVPAPTLSTDINFTATTVAAVAAVPPPTVVIDALVSPATVAAVAAVPAPTVTAPPPAIARTALSESGGTGTDATSFTTASISPTADCLLLAAVISANAALATPSLAGNGLTWVIVDTITFNTASSSTKRLTLFRAMGTSPTPGTVVISFGGVTQAGCAWSIAEFSATDPGGTNGSNAIVQTNKVAVDTATGVSIALGAFSAAGNVGYGAFGKTNTPSFVAGSGLTQIHETGFTLPNMRLLSEWRATTGVTVNCTQASGTADEAGIAIELKLVMVAPTPSQSGDQDVGGSLNRLAGTTGLSSQAAANVWAGTTDLDLVGALNAKAGTTGIEYNGVVQRITGSTEDAQGALSGYNP